MSNVAVAPKPRPVAVINDAEATTEILSSAIIQISEGVKRLRSGRLSERALLLLIQDACVGTIGIERIRAVLDAMGNLSRRYVK